MGLVALALGTVSCRWSSDAPIAAGAASDMTSRRKDDTRIRKLLFVMLIILLSRQSIDLFFVSLDRLDRHD